MNIEPPKRDSSMDLARILGCFMVIVGHSVLAFAPNLPTNMLWPIRHPGTSNFTLDVFYFARFVGVGVFMYIAGELTRRSLTGVNPNDFLRDRAKRLGRLLVIGIISTLPLTYFIWAADAVDRDYITWSQFFDFRLSDSDKALLLGPAHLWFLEYLLIFTTIASLAVRALGTRALATRPYAPLICMGLMSACAYLDPSMMTGFKNSFIPRPSFLTFNACIFAAGWFKSPASMKSPILFLCAAPLFFMPHSPDARLQIAACGALCIPAIAGFLAVCSTLTRAFTPGNRHSDLTLNIYLVHLPLVCTTQYLCKRLKWPEFPSILATVMLSTVACVAFALAISMFPRKRPTPSSCVNLPDSR